MKVKINKSAVTFDLIGLSKENLLLIAKSIGNIIGVPDKMYGERDTLYGHLMDVLESEYDISTTSDLPPLQYRITA